MPAPLDPATIPLDIAALRALLLQRETEHAAELQAARNGLQEQVLRNEQLKLRLAKLLRQRFGASVGSTLIAFQAHLFYQSLNRFSNSGLESLIRHWRRIMRVNLKLVCR